MYRAMILEHLRMAEQHVADGVRHIARQRELIAELRRDRHDTWAAENLLKLFEETQALHVADRDRLSAQLHNLGGDQR